MTAPTAREMTDEQRRLHAELETLAAQEERLMDALDEAGCRCSICDISPETLERTRTMLERFVEVSKAGYREGYAAGQQATWREAAAMIYDKTSHVCGYDYDYGCSDCLRRELAAALAARGEAGDGELLAD